MQLLIHLIFVSSSLVTMWASEVSSPIPSAVQDLGKAIQAQGQQRQCDSDGDGRLSAVEIVMAAIARPDFMLKHHRQLFQRLDGNRDGRLSFLEVSALMKSMSGDAVTVAERKKSARVAALGGAGIGTNLGVGGRAHAFFGNQQAYIQDYQVVNGQYDPVIGILGSGTVIDVADVVITIHRRP